MHHFTGAVYLHDCPKDDKIPFNLMVLGGLIINLGLVSILDMLESCRKNGFAATQIILISLLCLVSLIPGIMFVFYIKSMVINSI